LPIADCQFLLSLAAIKSAIGNWQLAIGNRQSAIGNYFEYILMMRSIAARQTLQKWSVRENMMQSISGR
jgi:hypothetical protein